MKNHKWKSEEETVWGTKPHVCKNCGIRKYWRGGDYQCWEYFWSIPYKAQGGGIFWDQRKSFSRPECGGAVFI